MALLKLYPKLERLSLRLKLKNEWLRPLRTGLLLPPLSPRFIAGQSPLQNSAEHLHHFLFGGLPRDLQQQRFGRNSLLDALLAQAVWNVEQRERFRHRGPRPPDLPRHVLMRVLELCSQAMQTVRLFKRSQIFALNILDQSDLKSLCVVSRLFDAGHFPQSRSTRRVIPPLA